MTESWTNDRGNKVANRFVGPNRERYHYDFTACTAKKGWRQYDTSQDASYFGVWVHAADRKILTFAEGDESVVECPTAESFKAELDSMAEFYGDPPPACTVIGADGSVTELFDPRPTSEEPEPDATPAIVRALSEGGEPR